MTNNQVSQSFLRYIFVRYFIYLVVIFKIEFDFPGPLGVSDKVVIVDVGTGEAISEIKGLPDDPPAAGPLDINDWPQAKSCKL